MPSVTKPVGGIAAAARTSASPNGHWRTSAHPDRLTLASHDVRTQESTKSSLDCDDKLSKSQLFVKNIIRHPVFETSMALIILFNFAMIIIEADSTAEKQDGHNPQAPLWIEVLGWVTLIIFLIELVMRLYVTRRDFFKDGWSTFDFCVIGLDTTSSLLGLIIGSAIPVSALRILRLCKLARVSKIFRVFPELRLMVAGLIGCMRSIFWGMVLLLFALLVWAVIGVQFVHPVNLKMVESGIYARAGCERCPFAYDSVAHAMITLIQQSVAGDAWGIMTVPMIEESPIAAMYFLGVMMTISMAMLNLILGVVVNVAMQARDDLFSQMEKEKVLMRVQASKSLSQICSEMDNDGSGEISKSEFFAGWIENQEFREMLQELGIEEDDLGMLWTILDPDKDGQVPYGDFIHGSFSMKESDQHYMLAYIKYYVTCIKDQVLQGQKSLKVELLGSQGKPEVGLRREQEDVGNVEERRATIGNLKAEVVSAGLRTAASISMEKGPGESLHLSEDDRKVLDDLLEKSQQLRDDLTSHIAGVHVRFDSFMQDPALLQVPELPIPRMPASDKKSLWCCRQEESQRKASESVIGRSYEEPPARAYGLFSAEDLVVLPSGRRLPDPKPRRK